MVPAPRLVPALLTTLATAALVAGPAEAKQVKKTYTVAPSYAHGASSFDEGNCSAIGYVDFPRHRGAISATVSYQRRTGSAPQKVQTTFSTGPLFDDVLYHVKEYLAAKDQNRLVLQRGHADGPVANDCAEMSEKQRGSIIGKVKVVLTYEKDKDIACTRGRAALKEATQRYRDAIKTEKAQKDFTDRKRLFTAIRVTQGKRMKRAQEVKDSACSKLGS